MTSFTWDNAAPNPLKSAVAYVLVSLFCAFFGAVYEHFGHGVYSYFMIYAFVIPVVLGAIPNLVVALAGLRAPAKLAANTWNAGVAMLTVGCIFEGALVIYGTSSHLVVVYPMVGALLLLAGAAFHLAAGRVRAMSVPLGNGGRMVRGSSRNGGFQAVSWERGSGGTGNVSSL